MAKNEAAAAMARLRWSRMTAEERSAYGRKRVAARWAKRNTPKKPPKP